MGTAKSRQHKINWFLARINAAREKEIIINKEKIIAVFCIDLSSSRKTALEILKSLEFAGRIKVVGSEIFPARRRINLTAPSP